AVLSRRTGRTAGIGSEARPASLFVGSFGIVTSGQLAFLIGDGSDRSAGSKQRGRRLARRPLCSRYAGRLD
ncbi:MAG: hypothetical protein LC808_12990, partial [Actinobacteria bacterium]|nr:hypothetical protein [Actinomycetota bacterium]